MEVSFASNKLEKSCSDDRQMKKEYGAVIAKALQKRLVELDIDEHSLTTIDNVETGGGVKQVDQA